MANNEKIVKGTNRGPNTILNKLMSKPKRASADYRERFIREWVKDAKDNGIKDYLIGYLFDGFPIADSEPIYAFAKGEGSAKAYDKLLISGRGRANKGGETLKVAMRLLAYELIAPCAKDSVDAASKVLSATVIAKNGKPSSVLTTDVVPLIVHPLSKASIDCGASITPENATKLLQHLRDPLVQRCFEAGKAAAGEKRAAKELIEWLKAHALDAGTQQGNDVDVPGNTKAAHAVLTSTTKANPDSGDAAQEKRKSEDVSMPAPQTKARTASTASKRTSNAADAYHGRSDMDLNMVVQFLITHRREHEALKKEVDELRVEQRGSSSRVKDIEASLEEAQAVADELRARNTELSRRLCECERECERLRTEADDVRSDLSAAEEMLSAIDERRQHDEDSSLKSLARALRHDYQNYLDSEDVPMSEEFGEIMRDQLRSVFSVIKSHGIEL